MKRPYVALMIRTDEGVLKQYAMYKTAKEAKADARKLAIQYLHETGTNTEYHSDSVYKFPDGVTIFLREVRPDGTYYTTGEGYKKHEFEMLQA